MVNFLMPSIYIARLGSVAAVTEKAARAPLLNTYMEIQDTYMHRRRQSGTKCLIHAATSRRRYGDMRMMRESVGIARHYILTTGIRKCACINHDGLLFSRWPRHLSRLSAFSLLLG